MLLAENPALLARFDDQGDEPFQEPGTWQCPLGTPLNLRTLPTQEREETFRVLARAEAQIPFDLARQPALRASLVTLTDDEHRLLVTMHEIILDGWGQWCCSLASLSCTQVAMNSRGTGAQTLRNTCSGRQIISTLRTSLELPALVERVGRGSASSRTADRPSPPGHSVLPWGTRGAYVL
jgi:Condensation domain